MEEAMKLAAAAIAAACLLGSVTSARAYEYFDSRGYRHWCQLSCARLGVHVPKPGEAKADQAKSGEAKSGDVKSGEIKSGEIKPGEVKSRPARVVDENDLAWEPPPGVKWQELPDIPAAPNTKLFKPRAVATENPRQ
jgi:uncharacterized low-complexity protein